MDIHNWEVGITRTCIFVFDLMDRGIGGLGYSKTRRS